LWSLWRGAGWCAASGFLTRNSSLFQWGSKAAWTQPKWQAPPR
tara:strand:- start:37163 stop:37291 length:129 start_codon:yes stop_codon:yes gene_type:complete